MKVALSIGHDSERSGAWSPTLQLHEWQWCRELGRQLQAELELRGLEAQIFLRTPGARYSEQMAELCDRINTYTGSGGLVLGLHFNSTSEDWAGGCALHWPSSSKGAQVAAHLAAAAAAAIGNRDRGAIAQAKSWGTGRPPLYLLQLTRSPACILEPFFGSNEADSRAADRALQSGELAAALGGAVMAWGTG